MRRTSHEKFIENIDACYQHASRPHRVQTLHNQSGAEAHPVLDTWLCRRHSEGVGEFKGGDAQSGLAFEDNTGTLRFLTNIPCGGTPQVALEVHRTQAN